MFDFITNNAQTAYWSVAVFGSTIFVVMTLLALVGGGDLDSDSDSVDTPATGHHEGIADFKIFSVRSLTAFLMFFGWGGVIWGKHGLLGFFAALTLGLVMMALTALILYFILKLQQSGNITQKNFVGSTGTVYLTIPGGMTAPGKVTVNINGCTREITALANDNLPTGTAVRVKAIHDGNRFIVEKID